MTIGDIHNVILPYKSESVKIDTNFIKYNQPINKHNVLNIWYTILILNKSMIL
jgi:hypothetical protein